MYDVVQVLKRLGSLQGQEWSRGIQKVSDFGRGLNDNVLRLRTMNNKRGKYTPDDKATKGCTT